MNTELSPLTCDHKTTVRPVGAGCRICPCCGGKGGGGQSTNTPWVCPDCKGTGVKAKGTS